MDTAQPSRVYSIEYGLTVCVSCHSLGRCTRNRALVEALVYCVHYALECSIYVVREPDYACRGPCSGACLTRSISHFLRCPPGSSRRWFLRGVRSSKRRGETREPLHDLSHPYFETPHSY